MKRPNRNGRASQRRSEALERQAAYDALSHDEKIKRALRAPGFSRRQLLRLGIDLNDPNVSLPS
jgi:hypothetical protein